MVIAYNTKINICAVPVSEAKPYTSEIYAGVQKRKNHHTPSVMNLPTNTAHVWGNLKHCKNEIFLLSKSLAAACCALDSSGLLLSCSIYSNSAAFTRGLTLGFL